MVSEARILGVTFKGGLADRNVFLHYGAGHSRTSAGDQYKEASMPKGRENRRIVAEIAQMKCPQFPKHAFLTNAGGHADQLHEAAKLAIGTPQSLFRASSVEGRHEGGHQEWPRFRYGAILLNRALHAS
ncbi:hypothetical protein [Bradyrhizobium sp. USDA 4486]